MTPAFTQLSRWYRRSPLSPVTVSSTSSVLPAAAAFHFLHQEPPDAASARGAMHQKLRNIRAVRLIGRYRGDNLNGSDEPRTVERGEENSFPRLNARSDLAEELFGVRLGKRRHETHRSAALDAIDQHFSQFPHELPGLGGAQAADLHRSFTR